MKQKFCALIYKLLSFMNIKFCNKHLNSYGYDCYICVWQCIGKERERERESKGSGNLLARMLYFLLDSKDERNRLKTIESINLEEYIYRNVQEGSFLILIQRIYKEAKLLNVHSMLLEFLVSS